MPKAVSLDQRLGFIGFRIAYLAEDVPLGSSELFECDIEKTLLDAAYEAKNDGRLRSLLFSWFSVHAERVIVEKFFKLADKARAARGDNPIVNALAVFAMVNGLHRYKKYIRPTPENEYLLDKDETESFAKIQGYKEDWLKYGVKVPKKAIRIREADVLTTEELSKQNLQFKNRLLIGASWRADIITAIEWGAKNPSEIKQRIGCSYEPERKMLRKTNCLAPTAKWRRSRMSFFRKPGQDFGINLFSKNYSLPNFSGFNLIRKTWITSSHRIRVK